MNRKLIFSGAVLAAMVGAGLSCSVQQPNEGCAIETGSLFYPIQYWARYTVTAHSGDCNFLQTLNPAGVPFTDSMGNWLAGEEIDVDEYGPNEGPDTVQLIPGSIALSGANAINGIGTLGAYSPDFCPVTGFTPATGIIADPNGGVVVPVPDAGTLLDGGMPAAPSVDAGTLPDGGAIVQGDTCAACTDGSQCSSGNCNPNGGFCDAPVGGSCANASDCGNNGGACDATDSTCSCPVQISYEFSDVQFEQAYSILGKQFHGSLQYTMGPAAGFGGTSCTATITVDAVQYYDNASGTPGHLSGNHCEMDLDGGDQIDCTAHAELYGFPATTGWMCMPLLDQADYNAINESYGASEEFVDGGVTEPDGSVISTNRCVPAGAVPIGASND